MTENQYVAELMASLTAPRDGAAGDFVTLPAGHELHDLEQFHAAPRRKRGTVNLHETASFVDFAAIHKDEDSLIFCDRKKAVFTAVLNADAAAEPRWGDHRAVLTLQKTPQWETWVSHNKHPMEQVPFAEFIEANLPDILEPRGADLLEMVVALEEKRNVTFSSVVKLESGHRQFTYNEEGQARVKSGQMSMPSQVTLELAAFYGSPEKRLPVLLRYRMQAGLLKFWYEMPRVEDVEREAVEGAAVLISEKLGLPVLYGAA